MFAVAFLADSEKGLALFIIDWMVEGFFYIDIVLNFMHARRTEQNIVTRDLKGIAKIYMFSWFSIDFVSVFPFQIFFSSSGVAPKLVRLARIPRLIKLFDKHRIKNIIQGKKSRNKSVIIDT